MLQRVGGVVGSAYQLHAVAAHEAAGRHGRVGGQARVALVENLAGRLGVERTVDAEGRAQLHVRPVVQRVAEGVRHGLGPLLKLLPVGSVAGDIALVHAVGAFGTPLVVVACQPQLRNGTERPVLGYEARVEVAVIVDDGLRSGILAVERLRGGAAEQKILVKKLFHGVTSQSS